MRTDFPSHGPSSFLASLTRSVALLLLLLVPRTATPEPPPDLHLEVFDEAPGETSPSPAVETLSVRLWDGDQETVVPLRRESKAGPDRFRASEACIPGSVVTVVSETRVGPPVALTSEGCLPEAVLPVRLVPRATVHGSLAVAPGGSATRAGNVSPPSVAELDSEPCPENPRSSAGPSWGPYPVVVDEKGAWSAPVPAGCVHLTLTVGDFARVSWWGLGLEAGDRTDLGTRRLRTGASVLVRVVSGSDGRALEGVRVALLPESAAVEAWKPRDAARKPSETSVLQEGVSGPWGWLRLAGIAPGGYVLWLQDPERPERFTVTPAFELSRHEAVFGDLELPEPARLVVELEEHPELPSRAEVSVTVRPRIEGNELYEAERRAKAALGQPVVLDDLHPGTWGVALSVRARELGFQDVAYDEVTLAAGEERRLEMSVELALYRGEVTFRGDPVKARMSFLPRAPAVVHEEARSYLVPSSQSDEEGAFAVFLPGPGIYQVRVQSEERNADLPRVEIGEPDEPLRIRLPEGRLEGRVVDSEGNPVPGATVTAQRLDLAAGELRSAMLVRPEKAREDGSFEIDALGAGLWELRAFQRELSSRTLEIPLAPDQVVPGLELVLSHHHRITGLVRTDSGRPVANAQGWLLVDPRDVRGLLTLQHPFRTGLDGRFTVELDPRPEHPVSIVLGGSGLPLTAGRIHLTEPLEIAVPEVGGRVEMALSGNVPEDWLLKLYLRRPDGAVMALAMFTRHLPPWQREEGGRVTWAIPNVAPGRWQALWLTSMEQGLAVLSGLPTPAAATFEVLAGQSVQVEIQVRGGGEKEDETSAGVSP